MTLIGTMGPALGSEKHGWHCIPGRGPYGKGRVQWDYIGAPLQLAYTPGQAGQGHTIHASAVWDRVPPCAALYVC